MSVAKAGIGFTPLDNAFAAVEDPAALQAICAELDAGRIDALPRKWLARLPHPFSVGRRRRSGPRRSPPPDRRRDVGCSLAHRALAFVVAHPDVTAAIIGPRTMDQFTDLLGGSTVALDDAVLDRIDTLVPPGSNLNTADSGWVPPALAEPSLRRRSPTDRSAA